MKTYKVAILGASGAVGTEFIQLLEERDFPVGELRLLASPRSAGRRVPFRGEELVVEAVGEDSFRGIDIAFFAAGGGVSKEWAPKAVAAGAVVIEHGGGSGAAYPIARDVMTFLFDPTKGIEALHALEKQWGGTAQQRLQARYNAFAAASG